MPITSQGKIALEWRHLTDASCDMAEVVAHALKTKAEVSNTHSWLGHTTHTSHRDGDEASNRFWSGLKPGL